MADVAAIQLPPVPIMEWEKFSQVVGLSTDVVRGLIDRRQLPSIRLGRRRFVNLARLTQICLNEAPE